jgi:hypothetical protein
MSVAERSSPKRAAKTFCVASKKGLRGSESLKIVYIVFPPIIVAPAVIVDILRNFLRFIIYIENLPPHMPNLISPVETQTSADRDKLRIPQGEVDLDCRYPNPGKPERIATKARRHKL